ncbi:MAG: dephospho-CoA kinase [Bacteroidia bacterium]|nr:dephospho-CoA kinase [Bacteroidia bacterium]
MIKAGITGGIGSGKSVVCNIFSKIGVPVFSADAEAKAVINTDTGVVQELINNLGSDIYYFSGEINRKKLASMIFNNPDILSLVNSIVHPVVMNKYRLWVAEQNSKYGILEAAILFESGAYYELDKIITVYAPEELRIKRIMNRDYVGKEEVLARMNSQMPEEEKLQKAEYIIYNDEQQLVIPQILKLHDMFLNY